MTEEGRRERDLWRESREGEEWEEMRDGRGGISISDSKLVRQEFP